jgi:hypothetical protein
MAGVKPSDAGIHPEVSPDGAAAEGVDATIVAKLREGNEQRELFLAKLFEQFTHETAKERKECDPLPRE